MSMSGGSPYIKKKQNPAVEITVWQKGQQLQKKRIRDGVDQPRHLAYYDRGPGAAGFILPTLTGRKGHAPTHLIAPEYTLRPFLHSSFETSGNASPGAAAYQLPGNVTHHGKAIQIEPSFGKKLQRRVKNMGLGPGSYNLPKPDVYLYRQRDCLVMPYRPYKYWSYTDAIYNQPSMLGPKVISRTAAQEVTLKGRRKEKEIGDTGPGPAEYDIKRSPCCITPGWTMGARLQSNSGAHFVGPKYSMEHIKNGPKAPAWKLGQRANDFTGIMRTPCDAVDYSNLDRLF